MVKIESESRVEYRLILPGGKDSPNSWEGGLEKVWIDEEGEAAFDADVEQILREAREVSVKETVDEFLAVIDTVKQPTVASAY